MGIGWPADEPRWYANYVLYRPTEKWEVAELRVVNEQVASNHRPVLAVLRRVEKDSVEKGKKRSEFLRIQLRHDGRADAV